MMMFIAVVKYDKYMNTHFVLSSYINLNKCNLIVNKDKRKKNSLKHILYSI